MVDPDGKAVADVQVGMGLEKSTVLRKIAASAANDPWIASQKTGSDGKCDFKILPGGLYTMKALRDSQGVAQSFTLAKGEEKGLKALTLLPPLRIHSITARPRYCPRRGTRRPLSGSDVPLLGRRRPAVRAAFGRSHFPVAIPTRARINPHRSNNGIIIGKGDYGIVREGDNAKAYITGTGESTAINQDGTFTFKNIPAINNSSLINNYMIIIVDGDGTFFEADQG